MSRLSSVLLFFTILTFVYCDEEKYPNTYDYISANDILGNEELRDQYYKCFMDTGPCVTPDQSFFKEHMAEVIVTQCQKCTDKQKENFDLIVTWYTEKQPEKWNALVEKFVTEAQNMKL